MDMREIDPSGALMRSAEKSPRLFPTVLGVWLMFLRLSGCLAIANRAIKDGQGKHICQAPEGIQDNTQ